MQLESYVYSDPYTSRCNPGTDIGSGVFQAAAVVTLRIV